jgi:mannose-6-phosphate isomerase-like protein (cupin superfamily)
MDTMTQTAPIVKSTAEWLSEMERLAAKTTPSFFHIRCQLPRQGRTNQVLGATSMMSVVLKTYAQGGENELHAHTNEDHFFIIMQGQAEFHGPSDEIRMAGPNDCVLLPKGSLYWFKTAGTEPLVMLRVGAAGEGEPDVLARVGADGKPLDGYSEANKEVPLQLDGERWFE